MHPLSVNLSAVFHFASHSQKVQRGLIVLSGSGAQTPSSRRGLSSFWEHREGGYQISLCELTTWEFEFLVPQTPPVCPCPGFPSSEVGWMSVFMSVCLSVWLTYWHRGRARTGWTLNFLGAWIASLSAHLAFSWQDVPWLFEVYRHNEIESNETDPGVKI